MRKTPSGDGMEIGELKVIYPSGVDHKKLLTKYIRFVKLSEGIDFIDNDRRKEIILDIQFSDEEWNELTRLSSEAQRIAASLSGDERFLDK